MPTHYIPVRAVRQVCRQVAKFYMTLYIPVAISRPVPTDNGTILLLQRPTP